MRRKVLINIVITLWSVTIFSLATLSPILETQNCSRANKARITRDAFVVLTNYMISSSGLALVARNHDIDH
jgi:hypothetical protein